MAVLVALLAGMPVAALAQTAGVTDPNNPAVPDQLAAPPADEQPAPPPAPAAPPAPQTLVPIPSGVAILGKKVRAPDNSTIGRVVDVLVDGDGRPRAAVIDFGGFLGVGSRKIAVDWQLLVFRPAERDAPVVVSLDKSELQAAPEYKETPLPAAVVGAPPNPAAAPSAPPTPAPAASGAPE